MPLYNGGIRQSDWSTWRLASERFEKETYGSYYNTALSQCVLSFPLCVKWSYVHLFLATHYFINKWLTNEGSAQRLKATYWQFLPNWALYRYNN